MKAFNFTDPIRLENERVLLEPLTVEHLDALKTIIRKDEDLIKYSTVKVQSADDMARYIDIALHSRGENIRYPFAIFDKRTGLYAGSTSYLSISEKDSKLEIGFTWIGRDFQRTGLNAAMKCLMLEYAFETAGCSRVELKADSRNKQSRRAMEKIGAKYEGELRSHMVLWDGERRSSVYYSILADEWPMIKKEIFGV